jgi:hypothetical protein
MYRPMRTLIPQLVRSRNRACGGGTPFLFLPGNFLDLSLPASFRGSVSVGSDVSLAVWDDRLSYLAALDIQSVPL